MLLDPGTLGGVGGDCHAEVIEGPEGPEECEDEAEGLEQRIRRTVGGGDR